MAKLTHHVHDSYLRSLLNDREIAAVYFQTVLPAHLVEKLDFSTLKQKPGSYVSDELAQTLSDVVYSCGLTADPEQTLEIALLIEHKSYYDRYVTLQIGSYLFSGYLQQLKEQQKKLAPIVPILFYHGKEKWEYRPLEDLFDRAYSELLEFVPNFQYIYNNLRDTPDGELMAIQHGILSTAMLLFKYASDPGWIQGNIRVLLSTALSQGDEELHRSTLFYVFEQISFSEKQLKEVLKEFPTDIKDKVMSTYDVLIEKGRKEGWAKAERLLQAERAKAEAERAKAEAQRVKAEAERAKAEAEKLESALNFKKMGIPVQDIAKGLGLTVEQVEKLK